MNYTWGEIQLLAIKKMFLNNTVLEVADLPDMRDNRKYQLYLNAMPEVANEGLLRLMSRGKPLIKKYTLTYDMPDNIFDYHSFDTLFVTSTDVTVEGASSKAYYFEVNNTATIDIQIENSGSWTTLTTISHTASVAGSYASYKGNINNPDGKEIRIVFNSGNYMYSVRNVALYNVSFKTNNDVYNNTQKQKYNLKTLISDFYGIVSVEYEKDETKGSYNSDFILEGDDTLVIDSGLKGNFIITYTAYPTKITSSTADTYVFEMPSNMISILPLYIASELYKDDNISMATIYRNQFEVELNNLQKLEEPIEFANKSNWL